MLGYGALDLGDTPQNHSLRLTQPTGSTGSSPAIGAG